MSVCVSVCVCVCVCVSVCVCVCVCVCVGVRDSDLLVDTHMRGFDSFVDSTVERERLCFVN